MTFHDALKRVSLRFYREGEQTDGDGEGGGGGSQQSHTFPGVQTAVDRWFAGETETSGAAASSVSPICLYAEYC